MSAPETQPAHEWPPQFPPEAVAVIHLKLPDPAGYIKTTPTIGQRAKWSPWTTPMPIHPGGRYRLACGWNADKWTGFKFPNLGTGAAFAATCEKCKATPEYQALLAKEAV